MAATTIRSTLSPADQAQALAAFLTGKGHTLGAPRIAAVVRELSLAAPQEHKPVTRKLQALLRADGIELKYVAALECISDMLGAGSWMRVRQQMLGSAAEGPQYRLLTMRPEPSEEAFESLGQATNRLIEVLRSTPRTRTGTELALLRLQRQPERLTLGSPLASGGDELPSCMVGRRGAGGAELPLTDDEVRTFGERLVRAVEYGCPGWVLENAVLYAGNAWADVHFFVQAGGESYWCAGEAELFAALEELGITPEGAAAGLWHGKSSVASLTLSWVSPKTASAAVSRTATLPELRSLGARNAHLQTVLNTPVVTALTRHLLPPDRGEATALTLIKRGVLPRLMQQRGLDDAGVAALVGVPAEEIAFARELGGARVDLLPRLARALGLASGNALAMSPSDGNVPAIRLASGQEVLRSLSRPGISSSLDIGVSAETTPEEREASRLLENFERVLDIAGLAEADAKGKLRTGHFVDGAPMTLSYLLSWLNEELDTMRTAGFAVMVTGWTRYEQRLEEEAPVKATSLRVVPIQELLPINALDEQV